MSAQVDTAEATAEAMAVKERVAFLEMVRVRVVALEVVEMVVAAVWEEKGEVVEAIVALVVQVGRAVELEVEAVVMVEEAGRKVVTAMGLASAEDLEGQPAMAEVVVPMVVVAAWVVVQGAEEG